MTTDKPQAMYMAPESFEEVSYCEQCGSVFEPRIKNGPNADKFCNHHCRDQWHNRRKLKNPPPVAAGTGSDQTQAVSAIHCIKPIRTNTKLANVLAHLTRGNSLNRFQAERVCHDHCLHSTVSEI